MLSYHYTTLKTSMFGCHCVGVVYLPTSFNGLAALITGIQPTDFRFQMTPLHAGKYPNANPSAIHVRLSTSDAYRYPSLHHDLVDSSGSRKYQKG